MPLLFSYGTLQQADVQRATFGRRLEGEPDSLPGYELGAVPITDPHDAAMIGRSHYDNVNFNGDAERLVEGTVFEVSEAELIAADRYEEPAGYRRKLLELASGKQAWVYAWVDFAGAI